MWYVVRRVAYLIPVWLGITLLAFVVGQFAPGDPAQTLFVRQHLRPPSPPELERMRHELGLDRPVVERYVRSVSHAVRGDLGTSLTSGRPVRQELLDRLPATLELSSAATLLAVLLGLPLGMVAALRRNSALDQLTRGGALVAASIPSFWLAYLLIILFSVKLDLLPSFGYGGLDHLVLPALALGLGEAAFIARLARSTLLEVLGEDYITTARAKGLSERRVIGLHAMKNALGAVVTQVGLVFGYLFAYSVVVEVIFVWPGISRLAVEAITQRDYPMIQGFVVCSGTVFILVSLVVDLVYQLLDPRVALSEQRAVVA
ncbi:MAG: peptide/nickel transport system permease protein [Solirubrobacteraceae bacterium]|nr:peptide/nickel transport system permease protein [Solirubrobacteraceae bacterium]